MKCEISAEDASWKILTRSNSKWPLIGHYLLSHAQYFANCVSKTIFCKLCSCGSSWTYVVLLMYTDGQTVNVPVVINESKVYLLNVLHTRNKLALSSLLWSCTSITSHRWVVGQEQLSTLIKRSTCHSLIRLLTLNSPLCLNEHTRR